MRRRRVRGGDQLAFPAIPAKKSCELSQWKDDEFISALAAACAETGDFVEAVKWQTKALEMMAKDKAWPSDMKKAREQLEEYRSGKPHRLRAGG